MKTCTECGKEAVSKCAICGKPLCNDHIKHGMSMRTNAPAANCPDCQKNFPRKVSKNIIIMIPILIIGAIILVFILNSIIPFLN